MSNIPRRSAQSEAILIAGSRLVGAAPGILTFSSSSQGFQAGTAAAMLKLLRDADAALERSPKEAKACIARASAMLQFEQDRARLGSDRAWPAPVRGGLAPWQTLRVKSHIDANLGTRIRMNHLAEIARLSPSYFSRAFKVTFGISPHAYIASRRIERAQGMMLKSDEPLCQIAVACGLCDQAHFSKLFRQVVGTTPNLWRRQRRGEPVFDPGLAAGSGEA
jgi:AraC-like DNA-binding protein